MHVPATTTEGDLEKPGIGWTKYRMKEEGAVEPAETPLTAAVADQEVQLMHLRIVKRARRHCHSGTGRRRESHGIRQPWAGRGWRFGANKQQSSIS